MVNTTVTAGLGSARHASLRFGGRALARLRAGAVTVIMAAAFVPATAGTAAAALPVDRIVYTDGDTAAMALRLTVLDGSDDRALTGGWVDAEPAWSPDGSHIAFVRRDDLGERIMVVAADGPGLTTVADGNGGVAWSPDGSLLAFVRQAREGADPADDGVWLVRPDGTGLRRLTAGGTLPVWAPDGSGIVFARGQSLYRVSLDGGQERLLAELGFSPSLIDWSPDGAALATAGFPDSDDSGVWVLSAADGSGLRRITGPEVGTATRPVWSPDGTRLAFAAFRDGRADVRVVGPDGTGLGNVSPEDSDDVFPDWSPDGTSLVFTRHQDITSYRAPRDLWTVRADGSGLRQVTTSGTAGTAAFAPGGVRRVAGPSRVHTAVALSRARASADAVVLARDDAYADALAAGPLAARLGARLLLTPGAGLHPVVGAEIQRLGATTAYLMGGAAALSDRVAADLRAAGVARVERVAGATRFDTARLVAQTMTATAAYVVEGANADPARGWPDAVAVSALAAFQQRPILLVERDRLPDETAAALRALGPSAAVTLVGGQQAVSAAVADAIAQGAAIDRVAGATRFDTSRLLADLAVQAGMDPARIWIASGRGWPDALAAGPAAAADGGVLLLTDGHNPDGSPPAMEWLMRQAPALEGVLLVGGPAAITPAVQVELLRAARGECPNQPEVVADPDHYQPGSLAGDIDGDGGTDGVDLVVDEAGPQGCQGFLVVVTPFQRTAVPTGSAPQPVGAGGPLPRLLGLVFIGDRPGLEVLVDLEAGASTAALGVFTMGDGELRGVTIAGEAAPVAPFLYGGSVMHQDGVDCTGDGGVVTGSASRDDTPSYQVVRRYYRLDGAVLVLTGSDQHDVPANDDGPPPLGEPFDGSPFDDCPT